MDGLHYNHPSVWETAIRAAVLVLHAACSASMGPALAA
jgi:hypothetical protein